MISISRLICRLVGHKWVYGERVGLQQQPTKRVCFRCEHVQDFYGEISYLPGTFGQFWYSHRDWRSMEEQARHMQAEKEMKEKYNSIINSK